MTTTNAYFSVDQTAELTNLNPALLRRWDNDGVFRPAHADANRRRPMSRLYSVRDVVTLRAMAQAKAAGAPGRELRKIARFVEDHPETTLADAQIYVVGHKVYVTDLDAHLESYVLASSPLGAQILTIDLEKTGSDVERLVQEMTERAPELRGQTERNRFVVGGVEVFAGTRIPVATIVDLLNDGWSFQEILANYPRLTVPDLEFAQQRMYEDRRLLVS